MAYACEELEPGRPLATDDIRTHYDQLSPLYRAFWGEHIHHGFWRAEESTAVAQQNLTHELARRAGIAGGERVLDIGCGLGGSSMLLAADYGCTVRGISISPNQIRAATKEAGRRRLEDRVTFAVEDANHLNVESESHDIVWTVECSEHLFDKPRFIAACARALKPGGRLAICAWLAGENLDGAQQRIVGEVCRGMLCPSLGTMNDYVAWMRASGLEISCADDVTSHVARTWKLCHPILNFPLVKTFLAHSGKRIHEFASSFQSIDNAYATGAMAYGMIVAVKPS
ncbi:MAG TPA: methyltransferase domain-containing protein [Opitutaceae bacterium]|nr:methyltransferase domain-containing protein [Opitutaceae bacterium]